MSLQSFSQLLKHNNEIGSTNKPPLFTANTNYVEWRIRFEAFISYNDPDMMVHLIERYVHPSADGEFPGVAPPKAVRSMTPEEKKAWDTERKTHSALTMSLSSDVMRMFKHSDTAYDLWEAIAKRCGGNEKYKKSKLELVKKQFELFDILPNESVTQMFNRYSKLVNELSEGGVVLDTEDVNKKLLGSLPKKWDHRVMMIEEQPEIMALSLEDLIGRLQAYALDMQKRETKSSASVQDPSLYGAQSPSEESTGGVAFISGGTSASSSKTNASPQGRAHYSSNTPPTPEVEENAAVFQAFLSAYDSFLSKKPSSFELTDKDFEQIDADDLERMDIRWNFAMLTRRAKKYLQRTGRKNLEDETDAGLGFDKSKVRCYNCQNLGHFAKECEKGKQSPSGFTRPTKKPAAPAPNALLLLHEEPYDWSDYADLNEDNKALMAHITSKNEVPIEEPLSCVSCIKLTNQVNRYSEDNKRLNSELEQLAKANKILKDNEMAFDKKLNAAYELRKELKAKIFSQQDAIDSYMVMKGIMKKELADSQAEVIELKRKLSNFSTSSLIFDDILQSQRTDTKSKAGLGFHHVPPPSDYLPMPSKDAAKDFVPTFSKIDIKSVDKSVFDTSPTVKKPEFVKATFVPPKCVEEVVEVEDLPEEAKIKIEKVDVKPENHIITTEKVNILNNKGKEKVLKDSKDKSNDKSKNIKPSTCPAFVVSTSTCAHKCACSVNASTSKPPTVNPPPKQFEGDHWNRPYVERRSCFRCGQQGHIIRDCRLLSLDRFGSRMPRTSFFRNSFQKSFSRRGSSSPVSSYASNSPKPMVRVNKVVPSRPQVQQHNIVENKSSEPKPVWKPKSTNDTSMKSTEFLKYHKLIDVMVMDDSGHPKSIKAWVSHKY